MKAGKMTTLYHMRAILAMLKDQDNGTSDLAPFLTADNLHPKGLRCLIEDGFAYIHAGKRRRVYLTEAGRKIGPVAYPSDPIEYIEREDGMREVIQIGGMS